MSHDPTNEFNEQYWDNLLGRPTMSDRLKEPWVCMSCRAHFTAGEIIAKPASGDTWHCPKCDSTEISPADGQVRNVPQYFGEIGTKN